MDSRAGELRHRGEIGQGTFLCKKRPGPFHRDRQGQSQCKGSGVPAQTLRYQDRDQNSLCCRLAEIGRSPIPRGHLHGQTPGRPDASRTLKRYLSRQSSPCFPERLKDLKTDCSCPDWSNPCKHIAAVYYLLGEEFDRDPFLIFKLRGMSREELLGGSERAPARNPYPASPGRRLRSSGKIEEAVTDIAVSGASPSGRRKKSRSDLTLGRPQPSSEKIEELTSDVSKFWNGETLPDDFFGEVRIPPMPAALPKRLGSFPFWRGEERFLDAMEKIYTRASPFGLNVFICEQGNDTSSLSPSKE